MSSLHIRSLGQPADSIWAMNATEVRDLAASLSPTPGGGSISVFTATLGLALVHKGASISLKRCGDDPVGREALTGLCQTILATLEEMSGCADEDAGAFRDYLEARSLPRSTDGEKTKRDAAVEAAIVHATQVPIASAKLVCKGLTQAEEAVRMSGLPLLTDIVGGALMMKGAADAALLNVDANVGYVLDEEVRGALRQERAELGRVSAELAEAVRRAYHLRIEQLSAQAPL
jgi:formiminotetrahydrofolate cyclodeaminase